MVSFVSLAFGEHFLSVGDGPDDPVCVLRNSDSLIRGVFERRDLPNGQIALRSAAQDLYLTRGADGFARLEFAPLGPPSPERFGFTQERAPDGEGLILRHRGAGIGEAPLRVAGVEASAPIIFKLLDAGIDTNHLQNCCGTEETHAHDQGHERRLQWDKENHEFMARAAFRNIARLGGGDADVQFLNALAADAEFMRQMSRGLLAADYLPPYSDNLFASHFYDPRTRKNYWGQTYPTAFTQALHYGAVASALLHSGDASQRPDAGFNLGLALHYVTDMSQPMHVANMINGVTLWKDGVPFADLRHSKFETLADQLVSDYKGLADEVTWHDIALDGLFPRFVPDMLQAFALTSNNNFVTTLKPAMDKVPPWHWLTHDFTKADVDVPLSQALRLGHKATAAFLLRWAKQGLVWSKRTDLVHLSWGAPNFFALGGQPWAVIGSYELDSLRFVPLPQGSGTTVRLMGEKTKTSPAVAVGARRLLCAWRGDGNQDLSIVFSTGLALDENPGRWNAKFNVAKAHVCEATGPTAVYFKGLFVVAWADLGDRLGGLEGVWFATYDDDGKQVGAPRSIPGSKRRHTPAMAVIGDELWFAWTGQNEEDIYCMRTADLDTFIAVQQVGHSTNQGPGLAVRDGCPMLFWRGADDRVWTSTLLDKAWSEQSSLPIDDFFWSHQDVRAATIGSTIHVGVIQDIRPRLVSGQLTVRG